jgi:subtilase family protein
MRRVVPVAAILGGLAIASPAWADNGPPGNLGNGLARLVAPPPAKAGIRMTQAPLTIRDRQGRVLVDVYARPDASLQSVRTSAAQAGLDTVTQSTDEQALEGYVSVKDIDRLAKAGGVASVSQALKPFTNVGAATSQGVATERVDRVPRGVDGRGITVGALSDSFDTATEAVGGGPLTVHAADDIRTGDLPPEGVTVIEDDTSGAGADEGRAMLQIVHDIAPKAKECFATAFTGDLGFANNIRALGDPNGPCKANVEVDDVGYFDEPFFSRGPISDAVDDVAAHGVHYFSSAGNGSSQQAYAAPLRIVNGTGASNIKLAGVDPKLYAGGFEDFDPGPGTDIAQSMVLGGDPTSDDGGSDGILDLQWDDPVDANGAPLGAPLIDTTGEITAAQPVAKIPFTGTAGQTIRAIVDAIPSGSTEFILTLKDPAGNVLQQVDTGTSPEVVVQTLPAAGTYSFEVSGFDGDLGDFTFKVQPVLGSSKTTTDLNALFFDDDGNFLFAAQDLNQLSGKPFEIPAFHGRGGLQLVIAKATTGGSATQLRYQLYDGLEATEYVQPLAPSIYGHPLADGATAVAAEDPFRPFAPEDYSSVGGDLPIYFDSDGNRLPRPDIRRVPQVTATDGGNTTFFTLDSKLDPDTQPNFFGTSAAAPHAAGIAALVLQARGRMSPDALRALLERSTFNHDLDVYHAAGSSGGLTITADGEQGDERRDSRPEWTTPGSMNDPRFFKVSYTGPGQLTSLTLDGLTANATGLGLGLIFDPRPFSGYPALDNPPFWQQGFPFTTDAKGVTGKVQLGGERLAIAVKPGTRSFSFGIDRDETITAYGVPLAGNLADQLGQQVSYPSGDTVGLGMIFTARTNTGRTIVGALRNQVGAGWTPVDGYGYLNAEKAVTGR